MLIMPRAEYITWQGRRFEGKGIEPNIPAQVTLGERSGNRDCCLEIALSVVNGGSSSMCAEL